MSDMNNDTLFVWRHKLQIDKSNTWHSLIPPANRNATSCPYCSCKVSLRMRKKGWEDFWEQRCSFCGFTIRSDEVFGGGWHDRLSVSYLKNLNINSAEVTISELNTHLLRKFTDVSKISPAKFEEVVGDVYKNHGFRVEHTMQTRDGGYDLVLLDNGNKEIAIVECKRYTGKVDVGIVRKLVGVQCIRGYKKAILLTSSYFTNDAIKEANMLAERDSGYDLELVDADILLNLLSVFNENLPPLDLTARLQSLNSPFEEFI